MLGKKKYENIHIFYYFVVVQQNEMVREIFCLLKRTKAFLLFLKKSPVPRVPDIVNFPLWLVLVPLARITGVNAFILLLLLATVLLSRCSLSKINRPSARPLFIYGFSLGTPALRTCMFKYFFIGILQLFVTRNFFSTHR